MLSRAVISSSTLIHRSMNPDVQTYGVTDVCIVRVEIAAVVCERSHNLYQRVICITGAELVVPQLQSALDAANQVAEQTCLIDGQHPACVAG